MDRVVVVGQGYVGLPLAMAALDAGHEVIGVDSDASKISRLQEGLTPQPEINADNLQNYLSRRQFKLTSSYADLGDVDYAIITVPTPLRDGRPDLSHILDACERLAPFLREHSTVILESTTYPGTTEEVLAPVLSAGSGLAAGVGFHLGYSPERIDPGNGRWNLRNTPKVVSGINHPSLEKVKAFYEGLGIPVVPVSSTRNAEMTKLLENTFRHINVALINEMSTIARDLEVDLWEVIDAASTKPFGFMRFTPGPGVGGHCLPVDPSYLSWAVRVKTGADLQFVSVANKVNETMPPFIVSRVGELLSENGKKIQGSRIGLLGVAYKKGSADTRESPSIVISELLARLGAKVLAIDSQVPEHLWPPSLDRAASGPGQSFDLSVLLTDHQDFLETWVLDSSEVVLDTRNFLRGSNVVAL